MSVVSDNYPQGVFKVMQEEIDELQAKNKRLLSTLNFERPEKYPDNCKVCKGTNGGVRGNENIIDNIVMCDYCHAAVMVKGGD